MIVGLTEDQTMLRNSVERLMADAYSADIRKELAQSDNSHSSEIWQQLAEIGAFAAAFDEDLGGMGLGLTENCVIAQVCGTQNFISPFIPSVIFSGGLLAELAGDQAADTLSTLIAGDTHLATAFAEQGGRFNLARCTTRADATENGYRLTGRKTAVLWGDLANKLLVIARTSGTENEEQGLSIFLVDPKTDGISLRGYPTNDGHRAAEITFDSVQIPKNALLGTEGSGYEPLRRNCDRASVALACEAAGACATLLSSTLEYVGQREQFGRPIGKFQVVQHALSNMSIETDTLTSIAFAAAQHTDMGLDPTQIERFSATAKAQAGWSGRFVAETALQMHGGIGMSNDLPIGHFLKRLSAIRVMFGDPDHHIQRVQALDKAA